MLNRLSYKKKITLAVALIVILIIAAVTLLYPPLRSKLFFRGEIDTITKEALLSIRVLENGKPGLGSVTIGGDCAQETITSEKGYFSCMLRREVNAASVSTQQLELATITYQSYLGGIPYIIPLIEGDVYDPMEIVDREIVSLVLEIDSSKKMILKQWRDNALVELLALDYPEPRLPADSGIHIGDLDGTMTLVSVSPFSWQAHLTITVHDQSENPVSAASVTMEWNNGAGGLGSTTVNTNSSGVAKFSTTIHNILTTTFSVTNVSHSSHVYSAEANHDQENDSNGTTITLRQ